MYIFLNKIQKKLARHSDTLEEYQNFFIHKNFLDSDECKTLIDFKKAYKMQGTEVMVNKKSVYDTRYRRGNEVELPLEEKTQWIYKKIEKAIRSCNAHAYKFTLIGLTQKVRVLEYAVGDHYQAWHQDFGKGRVSTRKLSASIQLSTPGEYEGGNLEFFNGEIVPAPLEQGSLIVFPSFVFHRVVPVTQGVRHSLVAWMSGPHFS
jgi:PKHD-type hydroxylase